MSFFLQLDVDGLTAEQGLLIEAKCREVGAWPVRFRPQRRRFITLGTRSSQPELSLPDADSGRHILSDQAEWDAPSWVSALTEFPGCRSLTLT